VDAVGDLRPECGLVDVRVDVDDQPVLQLLLHRPRLGEIIAGVGTRGNLLELLDPRRCFTDVHISTLCEFGTAGASPADEPYGGGIGSCCCRPLYWGRPTRATTKRMQRLVNPPTCKRGKPLRRRSNWIGSAPVEGHACARTRTNRGVASA